MDNITYRYRRPSGGYPGPGILPAGLTRHHIFSYPFMLTYAVVTMHYLANHEDGKAMDKLQKFYQARPGAVIPQVSEFGYSSLEDKVEGNMAGLVWICWAEPNLFIGPSGVCRDDDPSQRMEQFPLSLPARQMQLAEEVGRNWKAVSSSRIVGREDETISVAFDAKKMPQFVHSFLDYISYRGGSGAQNIHRTNYGDWALKKNAAEAGEVYRFVMKPGGSAEKLEKFLFVLRTGSMKPERKGVAVTAYGDGFVWGKFRGEITEEELSAVF